MTAENINKVSSKRIRSIRNALGMNQVDFGSIFGVDRQRMVSHWETGKATPPEDKLEQLYEFLYDPREWMRTAGKVVCTHTAILHFPWRDGEDLEFNPGRKIPDQVAEDLGLDSSHFSERPSFQIKQGADGLRDLVFGIVDSEHADEVWDAALERCASPVSKNPFKPVLTLKKMTDLGMKRLSLSSLNKELFESVASDVKIHGWQVIESLTRPSPHSLGPKILQSISERHFEGLIRGSYYFIGTLSDDEFRERLPGTRVSEIICSIIEDKELDTGGQLASSLSRRDGSEAILTGLEFIVSAARRGPESFDGLFLEKVWMALKSWNEEILQTNENLGTTQSDGAATLERLKEEV